MKETLSQMGVATMCVNLTYERAEKSWPVVLKKLKDIFGPDFKAFDEEYAHLDISLFLIAWEIHYIRKNYLKEQAELIEQSILGIIEAQDNGAYSLAELNDYMQLYDKEMTLSSKILLQLIRDREKFIAYKISDIDLRRTWEIIKPLTGAASFINKSYKIKINNDKHQDTPTQDRATRKNGISWRAELMKNWKVPAIILVLLIVAMAFRWSNVSSQTTTKATIKYKQDNWNGAVYQQYYPTSGGYDEKIVGDPPTAISSQDLTIAWGLVLTGSILWLLIAISKTKKVEVDKEIEKKVMG